MHKSKIINRVVHFVGDQSNDYKPNEFTISVKIKAKHDIDNSFWDDYETWLDNHLRDSFAFDSYAESYTIKEWDNINKEIGESNE